jgi:hypothetical protein
MSETPLWNRLAGAAHRAAQAGNHQQAADLGTAAREAWLNHCDAVEAQMQGKRLAHRHRMAIEEWDYEQGRGR